MVLTTDMEVMKHRQYTKCLAWLRTIGPAGICYQKKSKVVPLSQIDERTNSNGPSVIRDLSTRLKFIIAIVLTSASSLNVMEIDKFVVHLYLIISMANQVSSLQPWEVS